MKFRRGMKEWSKALVFALVAATLVNAFIFKVYAIPTPSMEGTLLVGDRIFVSKFHYGAQTAKTPIQFPLAHQKIAPGFPSYSDIIQLPQFRFPGITSVKKGDKIVFNYPGELEHPSDMRTYYVKRCVGLPGEIVEVKAQQLYVDGKATDNVESMQHSYQIAAKEKLSDRFFNSHGIKEYHFINGVYVVMINSITAEKLKSSHLISKVEVIRYPRGQDHGGVVSTPTAYWSRDNFGPLRIPQKGMTINMNEDMISLYGDLIKNYEGNTGLNITSSSVEVDGRKIEEYTFKRDYFFAMGDNRHNSADSRMWGFIPENHIVGKALFVLWSIDKDRSWLQLNKKVRFERLFKPA